MKNKKGEILISLTISIVIIAILTTGIYSAILLSQNQLNVREMEWYAVQLAESELNKYMSQRTIQETGTFAETVEWSGTEYTLETVVDEKDGLFDIQVRVCFTEKEQTYTHQLSSTFISYE